MVTAISLAARPTDGDPAIVARSSTLLLSRAVIRAPRWRAYASIQLVPSLARFDIPLDSLRADIRRDVKAAPCPPALRPIVDEMLDAELARAVPRLAVLERVHEALFCRAYASATLAAAAAALRANTPDRIAAIAALPEARPCRRRLDELARRGFVTHGDHGLHDSLGGYGSFGEFVGDLSVPGSELQFAPSIPLVMALVDEIVVAAREQVNASHGAHIHGELTPDSNRMYMDSTRPLAARIHREPLSGSCPVYTDSTSPLAARMHREHSGDSRAVHADSARRIDAAREQDGGRRRVDGTDAASERTANRVSCVERLVAKLPPRERSIGRAHLARALLATEGERSAASCIRGIREDSIRANAGLLLVNVALAGATANRGLYADADAGRGVAFEHALEGHHATSAERASDSARRMAIARCFASRIEASLVREQAGLAIARFQFASGEPLRARRAIERITQPSLGFERWHLRTRIAMQFRTIVDGWPAKALVAYAYQPLPWLGVPFVDIATRAKTIMGVLLMRVAGEGCPLSEKYVAAELQSAVRSQRARREVIQLLDEVRFDPFRSLGMLRRGGTADRVTDPLFAETIAIRAAALASSDIEPPISFLDGLANRVPAGDAARARNRRSASDNADAELVSALLSSSTPRLSREDARAASRADRASLERALYDEGVALSPNADRKRRTTVAAARACLRAAMERPDRWSREVVAARARTLAHFGGTLAREALESALAISDGAAAAERTSVSRELASGGGDGSALGRTVHAREPGGALAIDDRGPLGCMGGIGSALGRTSAVHAREPAAGDGAGAQAIGHGQAHELEIELEIVEALCRIDAKAAARLVLDRFTRRDGGQTEAARAHGEPTDRFRALRLVELYGGLPAGFTIAWEHAYEALRGQLAGALLREPATAACASLSDRARMWLRALCTIQGVPGVELLDWIVERERLPESPQVLFGEVGEQIAGVMHHWPVETARRVADDGVVLDTLLMLRRPKVQSRATPWRHAEWTKMLRRAASVETGVVEPHTVARCARLLGKNVRWLMAGDLVSLGVETTREVVVAGGQRLIVRLLQKRGDLLTYLRFADVPAWNCYRSDSSFYPGTRDDTIAVWKDPLSYCFRVESDGRPWGFVFGGFAEVGGKALAAVLNGLYLRTQQIGARTAVLRAIEGMLCRPLGIGRIGIASKYGGEGPLPADYRQSVVTGTRLRALSIAGERVTRVYDDVSYRVNEPVELDLWWRRLE